MIVKAFLPHRNPACLGTAPFISRTTIDIAGVDILDKACAAVRFFWYVLCFNYKKSMAAVNYFFGSGLLLPGGGCAIMDAERRCLHEHDGNSIFCRRVLLVHYTHIYDPGLMFRSKWLGS